MNFLEFVVAVSSLAEIMNIKDTYEDDENPELHKKINRLII